jgi:hypothetical protein
MDDFNKSFDNLVNFMYHRYRGYLCERANGGYIWGDNWYSSREGVEKAIDKECEDWGNRIIAQQNLSMGKMFKIGIVFHLLYWNGGFWFRFFKGYGIQGKHIDKNIQLFGERNGFSKRLKIGKWYFQILKP